MTSLQDRPRTRQALTCIATLLGLLGLVTLHPYALRTADGNPFLHKLIRKMCTRSLDWGDMGVGYYEQLLNTGVNVGHKPQSLLWSILWRAEVKPAATVTIVRNQPSFLTYELLPNLNVVHPHESRLITNEFGLADQPYTLKKPVGVRRLALIGDSVTRGMGVPLGKNYEGLLEQYLNEHHVSQSTQHFEVLNFATSGYRITQMTEVAMEKVWRFQPDALLIALTDLSVFRSWFSHLVFLIRHDIDLKYDRLREITRQAGVAPAMTEDELKNRLLPYRREVVQWALQAIKNRAAEANVPVLILLVPTMDEAEILERRFAVAQSVVKNLNLPVVNLLDTFEHVQDLEALRTDAMNLHPNKQGHAILAMALYRKLRQDTLAWHVVTGVSMSRQTH